MGLLFVGGVMNPLWIAAITSFVLLEKVVPAGLLIARISGFGFVASGTWIVHFSNPATMVELAACSLSVR